MHERGIEYWLTSAQHDLEAAEALYEKGKYDWCLFLGHLVIEKVLKAFYVRDNHELPPKSHKLDLIAAKTRLKISTKPPCNTVPISGALTMSSEILHSRGMTCIARLHTGKGHWRLMLINRLCVTSWIAPPRRL